MTLKPTLWITDYDGTIKQPKIPINPKDLMALKELGKAGVYRVVATGRSLESFLRDWNQEIELDYLIFSSGLGLCSWSKEGSGSLIKSSSLNGVQTEKAYQASMVLDYGFFAYLPPPFCHKFYYKFPSSRPTPEGFLARMELYRDVASPFTSLKEMTMVAQFLLMVPKNEMPETKARFQTFCPELSLTISTSPYNDNCLWLEIFPPAISKGQTADFLANFLGVLPSQAIALGNDYNDLDLLSWAGLSFVVYDAPMELKASYTVIPKSVTAPLAYIYELNKQFIC
jgi:hydroxymethylpyrimidine pyrophosphatase-like HAD family hydrolase